MNERTAPVITFARHRMQSDGKGVTTLVCFHGCPLRCKYCLNPFSFSQQTRRTEITAEKLHEAVKGDELYFLATGGGVTFGGGEPLLQAPFLADFRKICGENWHLCAETSLWVTQAQVRIAAACIDHFYVDVKDINPEIYRAYTGQENEKVLENLRLLLSLVGPERITVRLPLIPGYNTEGDRQTSQRLLTQMGITNFDCFTYQTQISKP